MARVLPDPGTLQRMRCMPQPSTAVPTSAVKAMHMVHQCSFGLLHGTEEDAPAYSTGVYNKTTLGGRGLPSKLCKTQHQQRCDTKPT